MSVWCRPAASSAMPLPPVRLWASDSSTSSPRDRLRVLRRSRSLAASTEHRAHADEEHGYQEHGEDRRGDHSADHTRADRDAPAGAGPGSDGEGRHPEDEGHRGHEDRPQTLARRGDGRGDELHALRDVFDGELHDQNRILRRESYGDEQTHLKEHVIVEPSQQRRADGADDAEWDDQHHRERNRPALVERRQAQKDDCQRDGIERGRLRARAHLFVGEASPLIAETLRELRDRSLHRCDRISGASSWWWPSEELKRRVAVIAFELRRAES